MNILIKSRRWPRPVYITFRVVEMLGSLVSRFLNAAFLKGSTRQTTSARAHIEPMPRLERWINRLFFWEPDHCAMAWRAEVENARKTLALSKPDELG